MAISLKNGKNSTYFIKAYLIPLFVEGKQYVNISDINIKSNCFTEIKKDSFGNNYLLMICSQTHMPYALITYKVKRTYNVPFTSDVNIYKNQQLSPCINQNQWCEYKYSLGITPISSNVTENIVYFYLYLRKNFRYNNSYSQVYTPPNIVFNKMQGTCDEISWLFEDILKNLNIPARYVLGIYFSPNGSTLHAWDEVWINDSWYDIDILANELYYVDPNHVFLGFFQIPKQVVSCVNNCKIITSKVVIRRFGNSCRMEPLINPFINISRVNKSYININLTVISKYPVLRHVIYNLTLDNVILLSSSSIELKKGYNIKNLLIPISSSFLGGHYYIFSIIDPKTSKVYNAKEYFVIHRSPTLDITSCELKTGKKGYYIILNITNTGKGLAKNIVITINLSNYEKNVFDFNNTTIIIPLLNPRQSKRVIFYFTTKLPILPSKSLWSFSISYQNQDDVKQISRFKIIAINIPNKNDILHIILLGIFLMVLVLWAIIQLKSVI